MLEKNGVMVTASFISPYAETRQFVKNLCQNFIEVFVDCPLSECRKRDVKGMYKKAENGKIENFTGVSAPYEAPENPEITIHTDRESLEASCTKIIKYLENKGFL